MNKITHITIINSQAVQFTLSDGSIDVFRVGDLAPQIAPEVSLVHAVLNKIEEVVAPKKKAVAPKKVAKRG